jgi:flagellar motor protein MotB
MDRFDEEQRDWINVWPSFTDIAICAMIVFLIYALYMISMLPKQIQVGEISDNKIERFETGSATLPEGAKPTLDRLYNDIVHGSHEKAWQDTSWVIVVSGHTDDVPINTPKFHNNWELSAGRALSVVEYLIEKGIPPTRIRAIGYGEYRPKLKKTEDKGINRRIEITLFKSYGKI